MYVVQFLSFTISSHVIIMFLQGDISSLAWQMSNCLSMASEWGLKTSTQYGYLTSIKWDRMASDGFHGYVK